MRYCLEIKHNCISNLQVSFPQQDNHVAKSLIKTATVICLSELLRNDSYINHHHCSVSCMSKLQLNLEDLESFFKCNFFCTQPQAKELCPSPFMAVIWLYKDIWYLTQGRSKIYEINTVTQQAQRQISSNDTCKIQANFNRIQDI